MEDSNKNDGTMFDFWNGTLFNKLQEQGLFKEDTDLGFFCSSDGVRLFKSRTNFAIWPIMLLNLNLPPDERVKLENIILCGFVPGPKNPQDLDSYMHLLVQEFILLQSKSGVQVWNGYKREAFKLHAYICLIGADSRGREKFLHTTGTGSYRYCPNCKAWGIYNRAVYCPFHRPNDSPPGPKLAVDEEFQDLDPNNLP